MSLAQIKRGARHRKDYGDLDALARSIDATGRCAVNLDRQCR
jgi:hypothetical protein